MLLPGATLELNDLGRSPAVGANNPFADAVAGAGASALAPLAGAAGTADAGGARADAAVLAAPPTAEAPKGKQADGDHAKQQAAAAPDAQKPRPKPVRPFARGTNGVLSDNPT